MQGKERGASLWEAVAEVLVKHMQPKTWRVYEMQGKERGASLWEASLREAVADGQERRIETMCIEVKV
jgi:hypothetical protein